MEKLSNIIAKTKTLVTNIKLGPQKHGRKAHSGLTQVGTRVQPLTDTCGHCVTSYEVTSMVNLCLRKKTLDFACPVCGEHWDWEHVKEQIGPSLSQTSKLEAKVSSVVQELPDEYKKTAAGQHRPAVSVLQLSAL
ncbi:uncharacterized protein LOC114801681 isoform X2 [Denticeps clupeoides]|uniref:uncharacterized protein LOC114801681 isoform X2 n=1 Tax=Denticeps clupeoides TaxID=299321 RepID=UPI0010A3BD84|nr:uncharacterized protein LOC114801681 isoform X2 [Denticeps clupeoides]